MEVMLLMVMDMLMATWSLLGLSTIEHLVEELAFDSRLLLGFPVVPIGNTCLS